MPPPQPPKKSNALLFILGGCAVLFLLGLVGVGIAGFILYRKGAEIAKTPPRPSRTPTTTKPSTGDNDSNGSRTTSKGNGDSIKDAPDWVVIYPGATTENAFSTTSGDRKAGGFTLKSDDAADKVLDFYEDHMKSEGFNITKSSSSSYRAVTGLSKDYSQTFTVSVSELGGRQTIVVAYSFKE
jgi:hypothetical protein